MIKHKIFDVFNGDADGIIAMHQYRLVHPAKSLLVTGVKRDIALLEKIKSVAGKNINVFDVSMDRNKDNLVKLLSQGNTINYFDHHLAKDIPKHKNLNAYINLSPDTCTSLIVNEHLENKYILWAITAAFGDNILNTANKLAKEQNLSEKQTNNLKELGELINYNSYGKELSDLIFHPQDLYKKIKPYEDPLEFYQFSNFLIILKENYHSDLKKASEQTPITVKDNLVVYKFPNESWANRSMGVFSNLKSNQSPNKAIALLTEQNDNTYRVSIRAPVNKPYGASKVCSQFKTGGGRKSAAGINTLIKSDLDSLIDIMSRTF